MADDIYLPDRGDVEVLRDLIAWKRGTPQSKGRGNPPHLLDDYPGIDIYVARTPSGGISPPSAHGTGTGINAEQTVNYAYCQVYKVVETLDSSNNSTFFLRAVANLNQYVYSLTAISGNSWVVVVKDKFGVWW